MRRPISLFCLSSLLLFGSCQSKPAFTEPWDLWLGQNLVVGIPPENLTDSVRGLLREIRPAGIIMYKRNFESHQQYKSLIYELQQIALETTQQTYFIMIDEEPGGVQRLGLFGGSTSTHYPDKKSIDDGLAVLNDLGVNVILGPLTDFAFNDRTFMAKRMRFFKDMPTMSALNRAFIAAARQRGISTTLKHFPGLGVFRDDPHQKLPHMNVDANIFAQSLSAFKAGIDAGADFVMTGHGVYENIDSTRTATLSPLVTRDLLRGRLQFGGLILSDDISEMVYTTDSAMTKADGTVAAIKAGHNLVMFSHQLADMRNIARELVKRMKTDEEFRTLVKENYLKVTDYKQSMYDAAR